MSNTQSSVKSATTPAGSDGTPAVHPDSVSQSALPESGDTPTLEPVSHMSQPTSHVSRSGYSLRDRSERSLTDRGLQYQLEVKERAVSSAVARWRRKADEIEAMMREEEDIAVIKCAVQELSSCFTTCEEKVDDLFTVDPSCPTTLEGIMERHHEIVRRVGAQSRICKSEKASTRSRRSRGSSSASIGMKAAAKAAEISAQLQYFKQEQELEKQQMEISQQQQLQQQELEKQQMEIKQKQQMLVLERELAQEKAKLQAVREHSQASSELSDADDTLAKLPVDTSRVEKYVQRHSLTEQELVASETTLHVDKAVTTNVHSSGDPTDHRVTNAAAPVSTTAEPSFAIQGQSATVDFADLHITDRTTASPPGINSRASLPAHTLNPWAAPYLPPVFGVHRSQIGYQPPVMSTSVSIPAYQRNYSSDKVPPLGNTSAPDTSCDRQHSNGPRSDLTLLAQAITEQNNAARLPPPEPGVFSGNPLEYNAWKRSFELLIEQKSISPGEKLYYLRRYVAGEAKECIDGFLLESTDCAYADAKDRLNERFGSQFHVAQAFRKKLREWPRIQYKDGPALQRLSDFLKQCESAQKTNGDLDILDDPVENQVILRKLPDDIIRKWSKKAEAPRHLHEDPERRHHQRRRSYPPFCVFSRFISDEEESANNPIASFEALRGTPEPSSTKDYKKGGGRKEKKQALLSNAEQPDKSKKQSSSEQTGTRRDAQNKEGIKAERKKRPCFRCKKDGHHINDCNDFLKDTLEDRRKYVKENKLCFACLNMNHIAKECKFKKRCKECNKLHPTSLHDPNWVQAKTGPPSDQPAVNHSAKVAGGNKASMVVPVFISHSDQPDKELLVYALLDTQSDTTFVSEYTCGNLGVDGPETQLLLSTLSATHEVLPCRKVTGLQVRGYNSATVLNLRSAYTKESIPVDRDHIPSPEMALKLQHLRRIANELMPITDCDVGLLIGYDHPRALTPREVIPAPGDQAYAQRTDLGWTVVGTLDRNGADVDEAITHRIVTREITVPTITGTEESPKTSVVFSIKSAKTKEIINPVDLRNLMDADFTTAGDFSSAKRSVEDEKFQQILNSGIKRTDDRHFEMPLPLRDEDIVLPNNRCIAEKRLAGLRKRLLKDEQYRADYTKFMEGIIDKGFAEKCTDSTPPEKVWYMPHHGVYHPKKKKIRVVFDASAQHGGVSLNDQLLQGPDLINGLLGILCRFRKEGIAICCDIEQMFYQFKVCEHHRDYFRFLWWEGDLNEPPTEFRMTVHLFGAKSSPGCANYGLKMAADYAEEECGSEAANFVRDNFYVDDGLTSVKTDNDAIALVTNTQQLCAKSGIRLHKFASNSQTVMQAIPEKDRAADLQNLDLLKSCDIVERTLGLEWSIVNDSFQFKIVFKDRPPTRRGILSSVSVIYDPLGFLAPVILVGKRILQDICQQQFDWDTPLPPDIIRRWETWKNELVKLEDLRIQRCYKPDDFGEVTSVQLHHFCDASTVGYGQCSYIRMVNARGDVHCSLVIAKSRVAPVKHVTVPRLELAAAVLSVRVSAFLERELKYDHTEEYFWTDSTVVLGYINSHAKRFHVFVANRIQQIRDGSSAEQWGYVDPRRTHQIMLPAA